MSSKKVKEVFVEQPLASPGSAKHESLYKRHYVFPKIHVCLCMKPTGLYRENYGLYKRHAYLYKDITASIRLNASTCWPLT